MKGYLISYVTVAGLGGMQFGMNVTEKEPDEWWLEEKAKGTVAIVLGIVVLDEDSFARWQDAVKS